MENVISVGKPYQIKLPTGAVGAISDFFRNSHRLIVTMPNISASEEHVLRNGDLFCGLLAKDGAILLLWEFRSKGSRAITLDSPFDARLVPELLNIKLDDSESRYCIDVHIVDSRNNEVRGLRKISMPPELSRELKEAVTHQMNHSSQGERQMALWMQIPPSQLVKKTQMWEMGM